MRTIILVALLLSCRQTTSAPQQQTASTGKFVKIDENKNKILVVDANDKKFPVAVHHVISKNSYRYVEQMSQLGNKFVSPDRLLRWEKMVLTYQDNGKEYTCVVSPAAAKSFHDDNSKERQVEIDSTTCEADNKLFVFARLCLANHGKIITKADLTVKGSKGKVANYYNGYYIKLSSRNFACVIKRGGNKIPLPSYCFIDEYNGGNSTMSSVFKDKVSGNVSGATEIDEQVIEAVFRTIVPAENYTAERHYRGKQCRHEKREASASSVGYQYKVGESEELEEVAQTEEAPQAGGDN